MPESGSQGPRWMRGWSSGCPVIHASPVSCSMVCAKPVWSRHGPERPKAGMRTRIARGLAAEIASQPSPQPSSTRGVKFSITPSACAIRRFASAMPAGLPQVEREPALVRVRRQEERARLPERREAVARHAAHHAHAVGARGRLDVDHVGAERGEHARSPRGLPTTR